MFVEMSIKLNKKLIICLLFLRMLSIATTVDTNGTYRIVSQVA